MSEPQHPPREGTQTSAEQSAAIAAATSAASRNAQAAGPGFFDSLAAAGTRLAQLREAKSLSVEDVSARLKVPPPKMRALEAGDISQFPGTTFALGVVRSYAKMLGVDPAPFTQAVRREKGEPEPDLSMPASTGTDLPRGRVSVSLGGTPRHRSWWWGVAAVVVALVALVMWRSGGEPPAWFARLKASANGAASISSGSSGEQSSAAASGATAVVEGSASQTGVPAMPGEAGTSGGEQAGNAVGNPAASSAAISGANANAAKADTSNANAVSGGGAATPAMPREAASPQPAASAALAQGAAPGAPATEASKTPAAAQPASAAQSSLAAQSPESAVAAGGSTVAFTVTQDSWFSVRDKSGKELFSGIVHAGDTKELQGEQPFKVVAGNRAGLQSVTFDGKTVDASKYAAAKGNVSRFSLP